MFFWSKYPFLRYTGFFVLGLLLGYFFELSLPLSSGLVLVSFLALLILLHRRRSLLSDFNWLYGLCITCVLLALGLLRMEVYDNGVQKIAEVDTAFKGRVVTVPEFTGKWTRFIVRTEAIKEEDWQLSDYKIITYVRDSSAIDLGDELMLTAKVTPLPKPKNPGVFDYAQYMLNQGITGQAFISPDMMKVLSHGKGNKLMLLATSARNTLSKIIDTHVVEASANSLLKALLLGDKSSLEPELKSSFANMGIMHILAVSGLHVGILYFIILLMLGQSISHVTRPVLVAMVAIPLLWIYAFITGLSPSVLRAVTMFSFIMLGQAISRRSSSINTVAISGFLLLMLDPMMLLNVGFQLSYSAVIAILLLYKPLSDLWTPRNRIVGWAWQLIAVSVAAQVGTLPLSLFYFHQFPTYFLLGNLVAIPGATILVWSGILMLFTSAFSEKLADLLGNLIEFVSHLMTTLIESFGSLPMPTITGIWLSPYEFIVLVIVFVAISAYFVLRSRIWLNVSLVSLVSLFVLVGVSAYQNNRRESLVFFALNNGYVIDYYKGDRRVSIQSENVSQSELIYQVEPYRNQRGAAKHPAYRLENSSSLVGKVWRIDERILLVDEASKLDSLPSYIDFAVRKTGKKEYQGYEVLYQKLDGQLVFHNLKRDGALEIEL